MRKGGIWTTNDGRKLDVRWMDSVHLAHSFNLVLRRTNLGRAKMSSVCQEILHRCMVPHDYDGTPVIVPTERETSDELCMLNAILETDPVLIHAWKRDKKIFGAECARRSPQVWTEYVKLKLTR